MSVFRELMGEMEKARIQPSTLLNATNVAQAKAEFLTKHELSEPDFQYSDLNLSKIMDKISLLEIVSEKFDSVELTWAEQKALRIAHDAYRSRLEVVRAAILFLQTERFPEERKKSETDFMQANERLYGRPDYGTFLTLANERLGELPVGVLSEAQRIRYLELRDVLLRGATKFGPVFAPNPETMKRFGEMMEDFLGRFLDHVPDKEKFTPDEACAILNEIIAEELTRPTEFRAVVSETATNIFIDQKKKQIKLPRHRAKGELSGEDMRALIVGHEFGVHTLRAIQAEGTMLESIAFPDPEGADEGLAKCVEQALRGKYVPAGMDHYINIGMATFRGMNFREVFEAARDLRMLIGTKPDETPEEYMARLAKTEDAVFNDVRRCFRGTGSLPNFKDLIYYEGTKRVWQYIEEHIDDEDFLDRLFFSGKTNFLDEEQMKIVEALKAEEMNE